MSEEHGGARAALRPSVHCAHSCRPHAAPPLASLRLCAAAAHQVQETLEVHVSKGAPDGHKINFSEKADEIPDGEARTHAQLRTCRRATHRHSPR
jgi:hypothetical protein